MTLFDWMVFNNVVSLQRKIKVEPFLYHLLEASLPDYPQRVPEHLHKMAFAEPVDALTGLKAILEQDRKYNPDDVDKLTKVINTIEAIVKPIPFS